jgi:hypothetical protein
MYSVTCNHRQVDQPVLTLKQNYKITMNLNNKPNLNFDLSSIKINRYTTLLK